MDQGLLPWINSVLWWFLLWVIGLFLVVAGLYITVGPVLREGRARRRATRALRKVGLTVLDNLLLPGPWGTMRRVDHVVRLPTGLVVLEICMRTGHLVGAPGARMWRQSIGLDTYHFRNPLHRLDRAMGAVRDTLPPSVLDQDSLLVTGQVLVPGRARFPRGRPSGVAPLAEFLDDLRKAAEGEAADAPGLDEAWRALATAGLARNADTGPSWPVAAIRPVRRLLAEPRATLGLLAILGGGVLMLLLSSGGSG